MALLSAPPVFAFLLALLFCTAPVPDASAQAPNPPQATADIDPNLGMTTLALYPGPAPHSKGAAAADTPTLTVFRPQYPNGTAVIVAPGGGYTNLAATHEGREPADRLAELGITAFVLRYRLGAPYPYPVPLQDARRAIRLVRSLASTYGYSPDRIGMMGFSAGGHLTAAAGTLPEAGEPNSPDPVDRLSSRLNFMVLIYPWLNAMQPQVARPDGSLMINYCSDLQLPQAECRKLEAPYTPTRHVNAQTPPTFLVHTADDDVVPSTASVDFYVAMHRAGADAELHLFGHGPHGFGPATGNPYLAVWQDLLANWFRTHGWLTPLSQAGH